MHDFCRGSLTQVILIQTIKRAYMASYVRDERNGSPATIADVARSAEVSMKTVSRVLNKSPNVKKATRDRVEQTMKALGYRPNTPARMLASNKTFLIGLIYNASSSYIASIQKGVLEACRPEHYDVLIHPCTYDDPALLDELREFISSKRVDGLVLIPPVSDVAGIQELLDEHGIANISISRRPSNEEDWSVCTNDREICKNMVRYLSQLGHQRIAFVRSHPDHKAMSDRYIGYLDGMAEVGLSVEDSLVAQGANSFESGVDCGVALLSQKFRPTAIFCANDHMAAGVIKVAHEQGLDIPKDISIAGFDDAPLASQIWPELTTVKPPLEAMAKRATEDLIRMARGQKPKELRVVIDAAIVIRQSTGPVPASD